MIRHAAHRAEFVIGSGQQWLTLEGGPMREAVLSAEELQRLLGPELPDTFGAETGVRILEVRYGYSRLRQPFRPNSTRPGGTISGPTMMTLADAAMYVAILASIGWVPLAVTTQLNIHFLRKPPPRDLMGECRILKLGKRLVVGEVAISSGVAEELVAHATGSYSIPPGQVK